MPTISISEESYDALRKIAEPLVDTPDSVIAKLVRAYRSGEKQVAASPVESAHRSAQADRKRARRGEVTPRPVYREALQKVLRDAGGELETRKAIEKVGQLLKGELRPMDFGKLPTGEERWINAVRFARKDLIDEGKLDPKAPHGIWRLRR